MSITELTADDPIAYSLPDRGGRKELDAIAFERTRMPMVMTDANGARPDHIAFARDAFDKSLSAIN